MPRTTWARHTAVEVTRQHRFEVVRACACVCDHRELGTQCSVGAGLGRGSSSCALLRVMPGKELQTWPPWAGVHMTSRGVMVTSPLSPRYLLFLSPPPKRPVSELEAANLI